MRWLQKFLDSVLLGLGCLLFGIFFTYVLLQRSLMRDDRMTSNYVAQKMMCIVPTTMMLVKERAMEHIVLQNDLQGYWEKVYTVYPFCDTEEVFHLNKTHTVLEFPSQYSSFLLRIGMRQSNFLYSRIIFFRKIHKIIGKEQIAVLIANDPYIQGLFALILSTLGKIPYVIRVVANWDLIYQATGNMAYPLLKFRRIEKMLGRITLKNAAMVFGGNHNNKEFGIHSGAKPERAFTIRAGFNEEHFKPLKNSRDLKEELGLSGKKVVIYVGRLSPEKYPEDVIRCFAEVGKMRGDSFLLMVGDGEQRKELEALVADFGINNSVRFLGFQPQKRAMSLMSTADVIVCPLSGSALVEAALSATPVVAYDFEWHSELIRDGKTGLLVPYRDYIGLAKAVQRLLDDEELARNLGQNARELAFKQHHPDVVAEEERECFEKLFSGKLS